MQPTTLERGEDYAVRVVLPAYTAHSASGPMKNPVPREPFTEEAQVRRMHYVGELGIDGWLIFFEPRASWSWDETRGTWHDAMAGRVKKYLTHNVARRFVHRDDVISTWSMFEWARKAVAS